MSWIDWLLAVLGEGRYQSRSLALTYDPMMLLAYTMSDLMLFASCFVVGLSLVLRRNEIVRLSAQALGIYGAAFIVMGASFLCKVFTLYSGVYRLDVFVTSMAAGVAAMTAFYTAYDLWISRQR